MRSAILRDTQESVAIYTSRSTACVLRDIRVQSHRDTLYSLFPFKWCRIRRQIGIVCLPHPGHVDIRSKCEHTALDCMLALGVVRGGRGLLRVLPCSVEAFLRHRKCHRDCCVWPRESHTVEATTVWSAGPAWWEGGTAETAR